MISTAQSLITLAGIHLLGCCSPGPVFLLIASTSAQHGRTSGLRVGFGVAAATFVWASLAVLGLTSILLSQPWTKTAVQLVAGLYLLRLAIGMIQRSMSKRPTTLWPLPPPDSAFSRGFTTSITNPKALAFFSSAFASVAPTQVTTQYNVMAVIALTVLSATWHGLLALIFATPAVQWRYQTLTGQIDAAVGFLLICLGIGIITRTMLAIG
jgi:threonine/homoserine/homoserine lactone efflux protein